MAHCLYKNCENLGLWEKTQNFSTNPVFSQLTKDLRKHRISQLYMYKNTNVCVQTRARVCTHVRTHTHINTQTYPHRIQCTIIKGFSIWFYDEISVGWKLNVRCWRNMWVVNDKSFHLCFVLLHSTPFYWTVVGIVLPPCTLFKGRKKVPFEQRPSNSGEKQNLHIWYYYISGFFSNFKQNQNAWNLQQYNNNIYQFVWKRCERWLNDIWKIF